MRRCPDRAPEQTARYDLIVSNPPYFTPGVECGTPEREQARYTGSLDHKALLTSAAELISEEGFFCVVLPESTGNTFIEIAHEIGWNLRLRTDISDTEGRLPHRVLLALAERGRVLYRQDGHSWARPALFRRLHSLTRAFYLFM